jgi:hypothetical protein
MTTMQSDPLVDDYLRRLEDAAAHLQRSRRAELVAEIREHIEAALRQEDVANEVAVRNVLERLGPPEEIVDAAEPAPAPTPAPKHPVALEIIALLALLVPVIGWLVGMVLVLVSDAWSKRDKLIGGGLVLLLVLASPLVGIAIPVGLEEGGGETVIELTFLIIAMAAALPSVLYLGWQLHRRTANHVGGTP